MQEKLYNMLLQENEITWQTIIYDLVKSEEMDPWDIDISLLTQKYITTINQLEKHNFFISGKVLLASAILLKIKSTKLLTENIAEFDSQLFPKDEDVIEDLQEEPIEEIKPLLIKTPQPRKRKINLNDLMTALKKALKVEERRKVRTLQEIPIREAQIPKKKIDISLLIKQIYQKILNFFKEQKHVTFTQLVNSENKEDKILTFLPLLHLDTQNKIDISQEEHFGEIMINKANLGDEK